MTSLDQRAAPVDDPQLEHDGHQINDSRSADPFGFSVANRLAAELTVRDEHLLDSTILRHHSAFHTGALERWPG